MLRRDKFADKVEVDFHLLRPVAFAPDGFVNDDFFYKLVDHWRCQFSEVRIAMDKLRESFRAAVILLPLRNHFFKSFDIGLQLGLFTVVVGKEPLKVLVRDFAGRIALIQLFY